MEEDTAMLRMITAVAILSYVLTGLIASPAAAQTAPAGTGNSPKGKVLVDAKGMTLYVFDKDSANKSNCNGSCLQTWPPFVAAADAKPTADFTIVDRGDGTKMWAYKGKPLYTWKADKAPGDITGDGFNNNLWHIATP